MPWVNQGRDKSLLDREQMDRGIACCAAAIYGVAV